MPAIHVFAPSVSATDGAGYGSTAIDAVMDAVTEFEVPSWTKAKCSPGFVTTAVVGDPVVLSWTLLDVVPTARLTTALGAKDAIVMSVF